MIVPIKVSAVYSEVGASLTILPSLRTTILSVTSSTPNQAWVGSKTQVTLRVLEPSIEVLNPKELL